MKIKQILQVFILLMCVQSIAQKSDDKKQQATASISIEKLLQQKSNTITITHQHTSSVSGINHVYLRQAINGIGVYGTESSIHTDASGKAIVTHNNLKNKLSNTITSNSASLTASGAIYAVANTMGYSINGLEEIAYEGGPSKKTLFNKGAISENDIPAKLLYYYSKKTGTRITWELSIKETTGADWWNFQVDGVTGEILHKENWTVSCNILGDHNTHNHSNNTELENNSTEPLPQSTLAASSAIMGNYNVYPMPVESPNYGTRALVANPDNAIASPFGWHDTNGSAGPEYTITRGNNTHAYEDGDNPGYSPNGGAGLTFNFPINETYSNADQSEDAVITNLFYWNNIIHDVVYQYGFDEASGNFQENNYGNGGAGSDYVNAEAQDGSGTCNANFGTPGDGGNPTMQMYVCGSRDGDLDNGVIIHEYGHGISNRLTGGAGAAGCLGNEEQMGEGWSDYYALMMTIEPADAGPDARPIGTWLTGSGPDGSSIRTYDYSTDFTVNPHTYDDIMTESIPHGVGSVWAAMLWDMTWKLIDTEGFDPDIYNGTSGNNIALVLVTEAMKLQPCSPGLVDGRDAIIAADQAIYGGAHLCEIWEAFAGRGLGFSANQGSSSSRSDGTEAFDLPPTFSSFETIEEVCLADGLQTGLGGGAPTGGVYSGIGVSDDGNGTTYTFDPSIAGNGSVTIGYAINDFCTGLPGTLTDTILVTDLAPEIICKGAGVLVLNSIAQDTPGLIIEDLNIVSTTINISQDVAITDLNLRLDISHTYVEDMIITLTSPGGTAASVVYNGAADGCSGDNLITLLDDASINALACNMGGNAFPEVDYMPSNPLSIFNGEFTQGDWTLSVEDTFSSDQGVVNAWGLEYTYEFDSQPLDVFLDITQNATVNAQDFLESVTLACGGYSTLAGTPLDTTVSFTITDVGLTNVALEVTSDTGITTTCTAIANVIENTTGGMVITCPEDLIISCELVGTASPEITGIATAISNCSTPPTLTFSDSYDTTCGTIETITRTWTAEDACENPVATCIQIITVVDQTPPVADCPADISVDTDLNQCSALVDYVVEGTDSCGSVTITQISGLVSGSMFPIGDTLNEFEIQDQCGNISECSFMVTVVNNNAAQAICQDITIQLDVMGMATITPSDINGGSVVLCDTAETTIDIDTFTCDNIGPNNVTLSVVDSTGAITSCVAVVTVEDMIAPEVICQNITVALGSSGVANITAAMIDGGSTDNCAVETASIDTTSFDCSNVGLNIVTLTVTDSSGNTNSCTAEVLVEDTLAPSAICQDITIELGPDGSVTISSADIDNGSSDNCGGITFEITPTTFDCSNIGSNIVNLLVFDSNGLASECFATVTVVDNTAPIAICQNITISLDQEYVATITAADVDGGSSDNCTIINSNIDTDLFDCSSLGANIVTYTIIDQSGNEATCEATVTVIEGIFTPNAVCQSVTVTLGEDGTATVLAGAFDGGSTGVRCVDGLSIDIENFSCEDIGNPVQIEFTVTNAAGVTDSCIAFANVVDGLAPEVICPADQTVTSNGPYALPDYFATGEAVALDNCTNPVTVTDQDPNVGTLLEEGTYSITLSAEDDNGFESDCSFELTVIDLLGAESPEILLASIALFPNPAINSLTISNPKLLELENITIYDLNGRVVTQKTIGIIDRATIDVSLLQSATYMVIISSKQGNVIKRLLIE
jgi:subtilisin-like proprotein convertase family protein